MSTTKKIRWPNIGHRPFELGKFLTPEVQAALNRASNCANYVQKPFGDDAITFRMERFGDRIEFMVMRVEIDLSRVDVIAAAIDKARETLFAAAKR